MAVWLIDVAKGTVTIISFTALSFSLQPSLFLRVRSDPLRFFATQLHNSVTYSLALSVLEFHFYIEKRHHSRLMSSFVIICKQNREKVWRRSRRYNLLYNLNPIPRTQNLPMNVLLETNYYENSVHARRLEKYQASVLVNMKSRNRQKADQGWMSTTAWRHCHHPIVILHFIYTVVSITFNTAIYGYQHSDTEKYLVFLFFKKKGTCLSACVNEPRIARSRSSVRMWH